MAKPTVAVLGASADRKKYGNISVRAHLQQGYTVYPINPREREIEGLPTFASLSELPEKRLDRITVYLPPAVVLEVLGEIANVAHGELWLNPGAESDEVLAKCQALQLDPIRACSIVDLGIRPSDV